MLARSGRGIPVHLADWAVEPKWDGWRCLARIEHATLRLTSRWRNDLTPMFPELADLPGELAERPVPARARAVSDSVNRSRLR